MGKKKGKGKPQGAQDEASSSTAQTQPAPSQPAPPQAAPPQSSQGDAPQKQGAIKKEKQQPSGQPTQHEVPPQQASQQSKKKGGKKGKQEDVTSQSQAGPEQKREAGQPQQIAQQAQRSQPQYQQMQMPQGGHPQFPVQQQPSFPPQHPPPQMPPQQAWGQRLQAPQHPQQQQTSMQQAHMYQPPPQMGQQPPQAWGQQQQAQRGQPQFPQQQQFHMLPQQQPQMGQPQVQRNQPQYPPQQQAQGTQPQYPPQQQVQGRGRPQQGQPHSQQQQQGGRGRGRPQQGQHPQHQAPSPQHQAPSPQHQAPSPQHQAPSPQHQAPSPQHQVPSPQHQAPSTQQQAQQAPQTQQHPQQQPQRGPQQQQGGRGRPQTGKPPQTQKQGAGVSPPTQQLAKLQVGDLPPMRFDQAKPGTLGRKIIVETNHLQLMLGNLRSAIHYDVNLVPDTPKKYLRQVVELFRQKHFPRRYPAFDGRKNLYSTTLLPFDEFISDEIVIHEPDGRDRKYKVEIKFANEVDLTPLHNFDLSRDTPREALQVVDIVLRSAPAVNLISVGRSFFSKPEGILDLGEGMEMYNGFYQSAIRGWKPFLNVDVAHKAFPKNLNVTDAMIELFDSYYQRFERKDLMNNLNQMQLKTFEKYIKTLRVTYEIPGNSASRRSYRVNGIDQAPRDKRFKMDNGRELTIENYFTNEKRYRLKYPHLPTLWVGDRNRPNPILLPLELCMIEQGQVTNRKMTENQTSKMIKYAATNTEIRKQKITTALRQANHNQNQTVREFGFSIANEFEKLQARILQPPILAYSNQIQDKPSKGVWRGNKFFHGVEINKWTIACADRRGPRPDDIGRLADIVRTHFKKTVVM